MKSRDKLARTSPMVDRCSTGIAGLDQILDGGFPQGNFYLIQGTPGVGKTTLGLQFLLTGARMGERALYVTLSETRKELQSVATSHGWDLEKLSIIDLAFIKRQTGKGEASFEASHIGTIEVVKALLDEADRVRPIRVVFDSVSELRLMCADPLRYRKQMLELKDVFAAKGATTLFLEDETEVGGQLHVEGIAHGVIVMEKNASDFGNEHRRLKVVKLRGSGFRAGYHNYLIDVGGLRVFPRLVASEHRKDFPSDPLLSGIPELDQLLGGGLDRGTSSLFSGPTGTGKSTLAIRFAFQAALQNEKAVIYSFEESIRTTVARAMSMNLDITKAMESGKVIIRQIDPGELSPGEFAHDIRTAVLENETRLVIIDSLSGYLNAMPDEKFLAVQMHELLMFLGQQGVITILTVAQHGVVEISDSKADVSYLADSVIVLRYFEAMGRVKKAISVIKKRSSPHEDTIREFKLEADGIRVGQPITEFQGVLTGSPIFLGNPEKILKASRKPKAVASNGEALDPVRHRSLR
ncbi:MAG TPA: ATPase domain-containing protein [Verrucomicrobiae bacterium]|nr:ATPase domain-containing protein [Verrucomicrobiae bacterium]